MPDTAAARRHGPILLALFFLSGAAALVYQVLWARELALLFGSTAQAAALTIAVFFAGIASGGWYWGRRAGRLRSPLAGFGLLEVGVAVTALGHFFLVEAYFALWPSLYALVGHAPALETAAKALLATTILLPPAFLMGGTLPLMSQHLLRRRDRLARGGALLYAVNTAGAAAGALAAGFLLPPLLGFRDAYLVAVGLDLGVGLAALALARQAAEPAAAPAAAPRAPAAARPAAAAGSDGLVWLLAFGSGLATLAVEVIWTRLFAQVLQNSVYTYALVLTAFLLALALGAALANGLCRLRGRRPEAVLAALLLLSALATAASPLLFFQATDGLAYLGGRLGWGGYLLAVAGLALPVVVLPGTILGAVLPYLLRLLQEGGRPPGEAIGRLIAANTLGAILGALAAGFLILPLFGAWRGLILLAGLYLLLFAGLAARRLQGLRRPAALAGVAAALLLAALLPQQPQALRLDPARGERLVELLEGSRASVAVVARGEDRLLRANNYYTLGGSGSRVSERNQGLLPLLLHPEPRSVFFLGMGTGITAGAALTLPIERLVVCEILAEVVTLARRHFGPWTLGLFEDPRVVIHAEDGRNCLRRSRERFDVIVSDLFTPWKAGTGSLYTLEHFETARARLRPGGLFVQWLPLYQLSDAEFGLIVRTLQEAFPQVVLWRGDLFPSRSIVALVARAEPAPLDPAVLLHQARRLPGAAALSDAEIEAMLLRLYAGNLAESGLYDDRPLNSDDRPRLEYQAPRTQRAVRGGAARWLVGPSRQALYRELAQAVPPEADPYLAGLEAGSLDYVRAGLDYSAYVFERWRGNHERAAPALAAFRERWPAGADPALTPARHLLDGAAGGDGQRDGED